jgi:hypothetical protein
MSNSVGTSIEASLLPWWQVSLPTWVERPSVEDFYKKVSEQRVKAFPDRGRLEDPSLHFLVRVCVVGESLGLDKRSMGKFLRLFKFVKGFEDFRNKVSERYHRLTSDMTFVLTHFENEEWINEMRRNLIPRRSINLDDAQKIGYNFLQEVEAKRKSVNKEFDEKEKALYEQLKEIRREKSLFNEFIGTNFPAWRDIKKVRKLNLNVEERNSVVQAWETRPGVKERYTLDGYLAIAKANKIALAEKERYYACSDYAKKNTADDVIAKARTEAATQVATPKFAGKFDTDVSNILPGEE